MSPTASTQEVVTLLTAAPGTEEAKRIARAQVSSIYWWEGEVQDEQEAMLIIKTTPAQVDALEARLVELHPYDVPELLSIPVTGGHPPYIAWVCSEVEG